MYAHQPDTGPLNKPDTFFFFVVLFGFMCSPGFAGTLVVPTDFASIQAAINAANPQDVVLVEPGNYAENLTLRSGIDVRGREAARTSLAPMDSQLPTVRIAGANDLLFANFTLTGASSAISVAASADVQVASVIVDAAATSAINADINSTVAITNNVFYGNAVAILRSTANVTVTNNIFRNNAVTITSPFNLVGNNVNVEANCWSNNADLTSNGIDNSYGTGAVTGNPQFVDPAARDFHLQQASPCIDIGIGNDVIDNTIADAGAYGGQFADVRPFPVANLALTDASSTSPVAVNIDVSWARNASYLVTNSIVPGGYRVLYKQNAAGPPYDGADAGAGTAPSPIDVGDVATFRLSDLTPTVAPVVAPRLLTASGVDAAVALTWEPVAGASSYRVHYGVNSTDENEIDSGNVTNFKVTGLVNGMSYRFAVSALTQAKYYVAVVAVDSTQNRHTSDFSTEQSLGVGPFTQSVQSNDLNAVPELIVAYPPLPDNGGCFIATAAYGADWTAEVLVLRDFRDRFLMTNGLGRRFVALYYRFSPPLADKLRGHDMLKAVVRGLLTPAVVLAILLLGASAGTTATAFALLAGLGASIRWRRTVARRQCSDEAS
jgi:hypothetical protein